MTLQTNSSTNPTRRSEQEPAQRHTPSGGGDSKQTPAWLLVATREIIVRVTNKAFIVSTLLTLVLIAGFAAFSTWQGQQETTHYVAVTGPEATQLVSQADAIAHGLDDKVRVEARSVADEAAARQALETDDATAWLHQQGDGWTLSSTELVDTVLRTSVEDAVRTDALTRNAAEAGTTVADLQRGAGVTMDLVTTTGTEAGIVFAATFAFALLFFMAAMMFGQMIAMSVVEEKQSRLVEIIASAIPLRQLLAGKVLGSSIIAIAQVVLFAGVALIALSFTELSSLLPALSGAVGWFIAFFAIGFGALACLFAVGGALASRVEDLQSTTAPLTVGLMLIYFVSFGVTGTAKVVMSYVPIASVIAMPARVLEGTASWWEPTVSLGITIAFAAVVIVVGERIYRRSLMQTRGSMSWRQAVKAEV